MVAKKEKNVFSSMEIEISPQETIDAGVFAIRTLEKENEALKKDVETLKQTVIDHGIENIKLKNSRDELEKENFRLNGLQLDPMTSTIETRSIKTEMLMAVLPQVDLNHAHSSAQSAQKAVDEIMQVWGFE